MFTRMLRTEDVQQPAFPNRVKIAAARQALSIDNVIKKQQSDSLE